MQSLDMSKINPLNVIKGKSYPPFYFCFQNQNNALLKIIIQLRNQMFVINCILVEAHKAISIYISSNITKFELQYPYYNTF